jgi:hypothetical protein
MSNTETPTPSSPRIKGNKVASAFLAAIQTKPQSDHRPNITRSNSFAPVSEILSTPEDQINAAESVSMISCNSEDGMSPAPGAHKSAKESRKPAWSERNRISAFRGNPASSASPPNGKDNIEKIIEDRVRVRVKDAERRMEEQLHAYMRQLEEKMAARVAGLEHSVQQLQRR